MKPDKHNRKLLADFFDMMSENEMTLSTDSLTDRYLFALNRYLGDIPDTTGTVEDIVRRYKPEDADRIFKKIALFVYGANLPGQITGVKQYRIITNYSIN